MHNRSIPTNTLLPHLIYRDLTAAINWLSANFGFTEHFRYGDPAQPAGAQLHRNQAWIMISTPRHGRLSPQSLGARTQYLTIFLDDVTTHCHHSIASGVKIVEPLNETIYGELQYAAEDLDGHLWLFSQHAKDLSPADWGATIATP